MKVSSKKRTRLPGMTPIRKAKLAIPVKRDYSDLTPQEAFERYEREFCRINSLVKND